MRQWTAAGDIAQKYGLKIDSCGMIRGGFDFNGAMNGTKVIGRAGGHPRLNTRILNRLDALYVKGVAEGWSDAQYNDALNEISDAERERIENDHGGFVENE